MEHNISRFCIRIRLGENGDLINRSRQNKHGKEGKIN